MSIVPLPVFEADADPANRDGLTDAEIYDQLDPPKMIVIRGGFMRFVGEYTYEGDAKPGCGSKLVARTHRGTEVVEMLTTTCENAGCSKSVTRGEMRSYIEASGGRDFPFHTEGKVLRVATIEDLNEQSKLDVVRRDATKACKKLINEMSLAMTLVEVEPILGGELLTFYYMSEERVDFRELVLDLASQFKTRIEMRQVGARDEARLVADYERCGQHCCCKNFLKVLKPVSMKSAKVQKATLDPLKISGRCGRLMCCLRYEDETYKDLKAKLPRKRSRVGTSEGPGIVLDGKILVQLVLVKLEHDGREIAVPVEELMDPDACPDPKELEKQNDPFRGLPEGEVERRGKGKRRRRGKGGGDTQEKHRKRVESEARGKTDAPPAERTAPGEGQEGDGKPKKRRRRRRGRGGGAGGGGEGAAKQPKPSTPKAEGGGGPPESGKEGGGGEGGKKRRRRGRRGGGRRRRGGGGGDGSGGGGSSETGSSGPPSEG